MKFWFDAGIHAREWSTISTALYTIDKILIEQNINGSMMNRFLNLYDIYFLVVLNPDGYDYSLNLDVFWRKNLRSIQNTNDGIKIKSFLSNKQFIIQILLNKDCFGVDLNR